MKKPYVDPGEDLQCRGRKKRPAIKLPAPPSLFDISDEPPPTPFQITSPTSKEAAAEIREETRAKRRDLVLACVKGSVRGLARFQVAAALGLPDHWITSSVDALIKMRKIEESTRYTIENPASGKQCAILIAIGTAEEAAA